jgi:hypothetical protein
MATGAKAIGRLAAETGALMASVNRATRSLQAEGLWPLGKRGGGQATPHVEPHHLINLMLALACAGTLDPLTESARAVARYRPLVLADTLEIQDVTTNPDGSTDTATRRQRGSGMAATVLHGFGNTFGSQLNGLLLLANKPSGRMLRDFMWSALSISMVLDPAFPEASLSITYSMEDSSKCTIETNRFYIAHESDMPDRPSPPAALVRSVTVPFPFFEAVNALYRDTLAHWARTQGEMKCHVVNFG